MAKEKCILAKEEVLNLRSQAVRLLNESESIGFEEGKEYALKEISSEMLMILHNKELEGYDKKWRELALYIDKQLKRK